MNGKMLELQKTNNFNQIINMRHYQQEDLLIERVHYLTTLNSELKD
jgi:hypothetical protein